MTVVQFRPRHNPKLQPAPQFPSPLRAAKACACIMIGLWMVPMLAWLDFLSEHDEDVG